MKRFLSMLLVMILCISLLTMNSYAATDYNAQTDIQENTLQNVEVEDDYSHLPVDNTPGISIYDSPEDPIEVNRNARTTYKYGPYSNLRLDQEKMDIVYSALQTYTPNYPVLYNNTGCYKFESGNIAIYISISTFLTTTSGTNRSVSGDLTSGLNSGYTGDRYMTAYRSQNAGPFFLWQFANFSADAFISNNAELTVRVTHQGSLAVQVSDASITGYYGANISIIPEIEASITNTGSSSLYFGSYTLQCNTASNAVTLTDAISFGCAAVELIGSVSALTPYTIVSFIGSAFTIEKTSGTYISPTINLSPQGKIAYSSTTESPYGLDEQGEYFQTTLGLVGTKTNDTIFVIMISRTIE